MSGVKRRVKITYNAPVVLTVVALCFVATIAAFITNDASTVLLFSVYGVELQNPLTWPRLIMHIFGHADFEHFAGNAMCLLILGPILEEKYGSKAILGVILMSALFIGVAHTIVSDAMLCGLSGVVFAFIVLASFTTFKDGEIPLTFILVVVIFLGGEIWSSFTIPSNVSYMAHIIGGVVGAVSGCLLNRRSRVLDEVDL